MKKTWMWIIRFFAIIGTIITGSIILPQQPAYAAATAVQIESVEYYEEQIVVRNNGNKKICFATETDAAKDIWEVIKADDGDSTTIDMSWLSPTVTNIIVVKGYDDSTDTKSRVTFNARPTKFDVSISYANLNALIVSKPDQSIAPLVNIMTSAGTGASPIKFSDLEWRKGVTGQWKKTEDADEGLTVSLLEKFLVKGTDLYFRICAVNDVASGSAFPDGTKGSRFSNEAKVKVVKQPPATGYGIDGSRFTADIKYGKEYRVSIEKASPSLWVQVIDKAAKNISLSDIVNDTSKPPVYNGTTAAFPEMRIEVRNYATSKAAASKITETSINKQRVMNSDDISVSYIGTKNLVLVIEKASSTLPYEYTIAKLQKGESLNLAKAVWSTVTKGTAVKIPSTKAIDGGTLFVRQKEIKAKKATSSSEAVGFELASTYVTKEIAYPSIPEIVDATYTFIKGYSSDIVFDITLNASDRDPFETKVKTIKLGSKEIPLKQDETTASGAKVRTLKITLKDTDLSTLANCVAKPLTITYGNGTVDKTSIKLTVQTPAPASSLVVTHDVGTNKGTKFTIITPKADGNEWKFVITDDVISGVTNQDTLEKKLVGITPVPVPSDTVDDIEITAGKYLTIFEVTSSSGNIMKYKSIQIDAKYIKPTP